MKGKSSGAGFRDIFNLLLSQANNEILALLSTGEYNTREIARILGRDEADVSRRLSRMRELGLVEARWVKVSGRNVKLYRLKAKRIVIDLSRSGSIGFTLETEAGVSSDTFSLEVTSSKLKRPVLFIGRKRELEILGSSKPVIVVYGFPGIGKTTLVSYYYNQVSDQPKYWHVFSELDYYDFLIKRLALHLASNGYSGLIDLLASGNIDQKLMADRLLEGLEETRTILVFDDYHKCRDPRLRELVSYIASRLEKGKLIVVSRRLPPELASSMNIVKILLTGLTPHEALKLLENYGLKLSAEYFAEIYAATQGHPGLLKLVAEVALKEGVDYARNLLAKGNITSQLWRTLYSYLDVSEREVIQILSCFDEPVPREVLSRLVKAPRILDRLLYSLIDKGLIGAESGRYYLLDMIKGLVGFIRENYDCRKCYRVAGDYYLGLGGVEDYMSALRYYALSGYYKGIIEAIEYRIKRLRYQMLDYTLVYEELLEKIKEWVKNPRALGYIYHELAAALVIRNEMDKARKYYEQAIRLLNPQLDKYVLASCYARMILLGENVQDLESAEKYARLALEYAAKLEEPYRYHIESMVHSNLSRVYAHAGLVDKVYEEVEKEYEISLKTGDSYDEALSRFHLAIAKYMVGRRREALEDFLNSYQLFKTIGSRNMVALAASVLAQAFFEHENYEESLRYAKESFELFVKYRFNIRACNSANYLIASNMILGLESDARILEWVRENCNQLEYMECILANILLVINGLKPHIPWDEILRAAREKAKALIANDKPLVEVIIKLLAEKNPEASQELKTAVGLG